MKKRKKICCIIVPIILAIILVGIIAPKNQIKTVHNQVKLARNQVKLVYNQIKSIRSIQKISDGFYTMDYSADYKLDQMLEQGVKSEEEVEEFMSKNIFHGYPVSGNDDYYGGGCTAFSVKTPDGRYISGKNFDYDPTDSLLVYTDPENGYASYSMVDLDIMGIGKENEISSDSMFGKIIMLAAPYFVCEGMNEKGVFIGIEELETEAIHQDNGKTDLLLPMAVRAMLDKCTTVDECLSFLENYDIHTQFDTPYHLLISDTNGKSVVVEWVENQMKVLNHNYCTNFQLSEGEDYWVGIGHDRYEIVEKKLKETNNILSIEDAMRLLEDTSIEWDEFWDTEWSVVYNQSDFCMYACIEMDYDHMYHINTK